MLIAGGVMSYELEGLVAQANEANRQGEALAAYDIAAEGLKRWPGDVSLLQIQALALARLGSREQAQNILRQLQTDDSQETAGLFARTYKDLWLATGNARDLDQACESYTRAYNSSPDRYWTGINAATLACVKGERGQARRLAEELLTACRGRLTADPGDEHYWLRATIAEAHLVLEQVAEAEHWYAQAAEAAKERLGDLLSTWGNARLLLMHMPPEVYARIERALDVPRIAVFVGHRIDGPDRPQPRFPEKRADAVSQAIRQRLVESRVRIGYSSAASGADIVFLEAVQALGGRTYVVLPCEREQFVEESVAGAGESWVARFGAVLKRANEVIVASRERLTLGSVAYDFASELQYGLAALRAAQYGTDLVPMAVWDGHEGDGPGGTADVVRRWKQRAREVITIRPMETEPARSISPRAIASADAAAVSGFGAEIRAMLFADAFHFSHLSEVQMPAFIQRFMAPIAMLIRQTRPRPLFQNTWGDGLYLVFPGVREAGLFALALARRVSEIDRKGANLPEDMALRISLHAGPVYRYTDPIIERVNYLGSHVNRAARIEPVTPPGQIYVTDAFAALAAVEAPGLFRFDYVGRIPLAKNYGEFPMYHMRAGD
jgi:class 3 adenylate cyclase/tetratricopeptide (TPR) repeat protein